MTIEASDDLVRILKDSHKVATKATVIQNRKDPIQDLDILDGNVHIDSAVKHRRTAEIRVTDPTGLLVPSELEDLLHPLSGHEIWLYRGAYVPSRGEDELVQLGAFVIKDSEVVDSGAGLNVSLKLIDRSLQVSRARSVTPLGTSPGSHVGTVIRDVIDFRYPQVDFANDFTLVRPWVTMGAGLLDRAVDVWETLVKWGRDGGLDLRFNNEGLLTLSEMPSDLHTASDVAWQFHEGDLSTILSIRHSITSDDTFNHVVVYGQNTDGSTPVFAEAKVTDTEHPLNIYGPMGDIPFFYSSNLFTSTEQAQVVANSLLYRHLGYTTRTHFNAIVNPCVEDGDLISVKREVSKIDAFYTLDKITIPMTALRAMECDTRERFISSV